MIDLGGQIVLDVVLFGSGVLQVVLLALEHLDALRVLFQDRNQLRCNYAIIASLFA